MKGCNNFPASGLNHMITMTVRKLVTFGNNLVPHGEQMSSRFCLM